MAQYWQQSGLAISTGRMQVKENQSAQPGVTVVDTECFCIHQQLMEHSALDDAAKLKKKKKKKNRRLFSRRSQRVYDGSSREPRVKF